MTVEAKARNKIKGRIAEAGVRRRDVAHAVGYSESMFSLILQGDRTMPLDFDSRVRAAIDRLETAEKAAQEARERVLAESTDEDLDIDEYRRPSATSTEER